MPLIIQYFIVFKAVKALSFRSGFLYYFTYFFLLVQKNQYNPNRQTPNQTQKTTGLGFKKTRGFLTLGT